MESYYDRSQSFNKNIIIFMVFITYKYLNVEIKLLKIISTPETFLVLSDAEKTFKVELFVTDYGELLIFSFRRNQAKKFCNQLSRSYT